MAEHFTKLSSLIDFLNYTDKDEKECILDGLQEMFASALDY